MTVYTKYVVELYITHMHAHWILASAQGNHICMHHHYHNIIKLIKFASCDYSCALRSIITLAKNLMILNGFCDNYYVRQLTRK